MQALSDVDVFRGLLGYGMFAENMPKIFTSVGFMNFCETMAPSFSKKGRDYVRYESMRNINVVRMMGIPNPFAYFNLCKVISENWSRLKGHFDLQTMNHSYKVSRIHVRKRQGTAKIFEMGYKPWRLDDTPSADLKIGARVAVHADISSCFPSICSHAIPWAIAGKPYSKQKKNDWLKDLDSAIMGIKYDETNGILIGPHASSIISETILTKVDNKLMETYSYQRNIDDYLGYCKSTDLAEEFIFSLRSELKVYDLHLNNKKTKITNLPEPIETEWTNKLKSEVPIGVNNIVGYAEMQRFLDLVLSLLENNNENSAILKYALKILRKKKFTKGARICAQKFLLQFAVIYPYLYPYLDTLAFDLFDLDQTIIGAWCNEHFSFHNERGNYEAVAYMLCYAIKYNFKIDDFSVDKLIDSPDCVIKTIGSLYFKKHFPKGKKIKKDIYANAIELNKNPAISDQYWLYWYTVLTENDLSDDWKNIKKQKVSFIL